jgi:hypothetical protein
MLALVNLPLAMTSALTINWPAFGASRLEPPAVGRHRVGLSELVRNSEPREITTVGNMLIN